MELKEILCHFLDGNGRLTAFPVKRKMKLYALQYLAEALPLCRGKMYTEKEINAAINALTTFEDPATLRCELCGNGYLGRKTDCSAYWVENTVS